jgi:hypothetical protein
MYVDVNDIYGAHMPPAQPLLHSTLRTSRETDHMGSLAPSQSVLRNIEHLRFKIT